MKVTIHCIGTCRAQEKRHEHTTIGQIPERRPLLLIRWFHHIVGLGVFTLSMSYLLSGCSYSDPFTLIAGATSGMMLTGTAVEMGGGLLLKSIEGVDKGNSTVSFSPEATTELTEAKKVAVQFGATSGFADLMDSDMPFSPGVSVLNDAMSGHLLQMGYDVVGKEAQRSVNEKTSVTTIRLADLKEKGVDLLIGGSIASTETMKMRGFFLGSPDMQSRSVISSASLRVTSCADEKLLMTVVITYKKGKTPQDVAKDLALIIRAARGESGDLVAGSGN